MSTRSIVEAIGQKDATLDHPSTQAPYHVPGKKLLYLGWPNRLQAKTNDNGFTDCPGGGGVQDRDCSRMEQNAEKH